MTRMVAPRSPTRPRPSPTIVSPSPAWTRRCCRTCGTTQAVEDLEAFREWLGVEKLALYGESYGTQYVQT